jgi:hypothetical protein
MDLDAMPKAPKEVGALGKKEFSKDKGYTISHIIMNCM